MKEQQRTAEARRRQQLSVVRVECWWGGGGALVEEKKDLERKALMAATGCSVSRNGTFIPFIETSVLAN